MNNSIYYLDLYSEDKKIRNAGFMRVINNTAIITLLRNVCYINTYIDPVIDLTDGEESKFEEIHINEKQSNYKQNVYVCGLGVPVEQIASIRIELENQRSIRCIVNKSQKSLKAADEGTQKKSSDKFQSQINYISSISPEKWDQITNTHKQIHLFPEAETVVIRPEEMVILTSRFHKLATNSFVLHAYYNYRQLLLFRYRSYDQKPETAYFIGVPGIYTERERRIALMFGFEGFENGEARLQNEEKRDAYTGCFGYYMKKVDI